MVESPVKRVAVFLRTALDIDCSFILNGIFAHRFFEVHRLAGLDNLLAYDVLNHLLSSVFLIYAGVTVDLHLQLYHATEIGRHHEVRAVLLGELGRFGGIDTRLSHLNQFLDGLAKVCLEHVVSLVQTIQRHTVQHADINSHGRHDVLDEHVRLIATCKPGFGENTVFAEVNTTTGHANVVNGVLRLRMAHFLKRVTAEDVQGRIVATL